MSNKQYIIKTDEKTVFTVSEFQLWKPRWLSYFGGKEEVQNFIKNYNKK